MSINQPQNFDQAQNSDIVGEDNLDNDDLVTFQNDSKTINFYYSQLTKYSKHIRHSYLFKDVNDRFPQELHQFQGKYQLLQESVSFFFFQLLQQNCNINKDIKLTYTECIVRCTVFNGNGLSNELVSNSMTTSGGKIR